MAIAPLRRQERNQDIINERIRDLMEGRRNAHGELDIDNDGVATSTTVSAPTCSSESHVSITPLDANAAALVGSANSVYVVPANGQFVVYHDATSNASAFRWSLHG